MPTVVSTPSTLVENVNFLMEVALWSKANIRLVLVSIAALSVFMVLILFSSASSRFGYRPVTLQGQSNASQSPSTPTRVNPKHVQQFEEQVPATDYDSPEPADPAVKAKRRKKNKRYDGKNLVMSNPSGSGGATTVMSEVFLDLPALPVAQSDVILTADVLNSEAHLSNDKTGVYSEFTVQVDSVLKGVIATLSQTNLVSLSRFGGSVRYSSGRKEIYGVAHQNMPRPGKRYLFFLRPIEDTQDYEIVTGYEIGPQHVKALDYGPRFEAFDGTETAGFLTTVRAVIAAVSTTKR